jgi:cytochrome c551/c552
MKRIGILIISAVCIIALNIAWADEGETIFKSQGCMSCHKKESTSKVNPSLSEISQAYQGKEAQLIEYLKGESEAIVKPEKSNLMKRKIEKTKNLSDADRKALAEFILSHHN